MMGSSMQEERRNAKISRRTLERGIAYSMDGLVSKYIHGFFSNI
jgi:hypothetical protein